MATSTKPADGLRALAAVFVSAAMAVFVPVAPAAGHPATATPRATAAVPRPDHTVVVIEENHSYSSVIGSGSAPYINALAGQGALFTRSFAVSHPSEPNYLALFSGSTQGLTDDSCPHTYSGANLGQELIGAGLSFTGYSESMPSAGYTGCTSGTYARKHNPWVNFTNVPASDNLTFSSFPSNYASLPTLSVVVPNLQNDMHDGTVAQGDTWLKNNIDGYAQWAKAHNSLLVVTWDEDDSSSSNQIPTIMVGQQVKPGTYNEQINHYSVLRTLEDAYALPYAGASASASPITDVWNGSAGGAVTVTNPGSRTGTVGTGTSLQIQATDTAGGALSYTATGLPAGLSINATTGLISGTPTAAGTFNVSVTATDSTGPSAATSFTWTIGSTGGCVGGGQLLGNAGFETGTASPWSAASGVVSNSSSEPPHTGSWDAWLDGYGSTHTDTMAQSVTLPAGCGSYALSFWLHVDTAETTTSGKYDTLSVQVLGPSGTVLATLATFSNLDHNTGYAQHSYSLAGYAGQGVTVRFTGAEDYTLQTSFVIDDTALTVS
jgi:hypothetical protein